MPTTLKTRKPIDQLTPADLEAFPLWEYATDEEGHEDQDETWVRPLPHQTIGLEAYSLTVAADFQTPTGLTIPGIIGISTAEGFQPGHAALLPEGQYIFIPANDYTDAPKDRKAAAKALGLKPPQLFPLQYTLRLPLQGEPTPRQGTLG